MTRTTRTSFLLVAIGVALAFIAASCSGGSGTDSSDSSETDSAATDRTESTDEAGSSPDTTTSDTIGSRTDPLEGATALAPVLTFPVDDGELISSVAVSPDGTMVAVSLQDELGALITIRLYDAQTGAVGPEATLDAVGLGRLSWMADDRIVAEDGVRMNWHSWDGTTLEEFPTQPFEYDCRPTEVDRIAGYAYSVVEDETAICRTDPDTGETVRSATGDLADVGSIWVRPGTGEILALNRSEDGDQVELVTFDGETLERVAAVELADGDQVKAVGVTTWMDYFDPRVSLLEPGALPAPDLRDQVSESVAGTYFSTSNGNNDQAFVAAADGSVLGTMTAAWSTLFQDWSIDDSVMIRLNLDYEIERYEF